jgi:hypothetical protein
MKPTFKGAFFPFWHVACVSHSLPSEERSLMYSEGVQLVL